MLSETGSFTGTWLEDILDEAVHYSQTLTLTLTTGCRLVITELLELAGWQRCPRQQDIEIMVIERIMSMYAIFCDHSGDLKTFLTPIHTRNTI